MSKYSTKPLRYSLGCLMGVSLCATSLYPIITLAQDEPAGGMMCHAVADNDKRGDSEDMLIKIYADGTAVEVGIGTGTKNMEAISFNISGETLYVVAEPAEDGSSDGSRFGTLDLEEGSSTWGQFVPIGNGLGTATGAEGPILIDDVDSMTFDYATEGSTYATLRREHTNPPQYDLLFKINPHTGTLVSNTFGAGIDYVPVTITNIESCTIDSDDRAQDNYYDVDDIASDPQDGTLYAVINTGNGVESVLARLVVANGVPTGEAICIGYNEVDDIESLDFEKTAQPDGSYRLYGTTGNGGHRKGDDPTAKSHIYLIDKNSGAATKLGKLKQPLQPNQDYEAVSCQPLEPNPSCVMYALHDEGQYDSQLVEIDPFAGSGIGAIRPLGPLYPGLDIEGLAVLPTNGKLYGTSGSDQKKIDGVPIPDGALYEFDRITGLINYIGLTGYSEVSGLALRATDNTLWGWARGGNRRQKSPVGPVIINPVTGEGSLPDGVTDDKFKFHDPDIQSIAWSNDGQTLYGATPTDEGSDLWAYDYESQELTLICPQTVPAEIEAMEMQPDDLLILGTHSNRDIGMVAYDPEKCEVVATRTFKDVPEYYDIESIEWPAVECRQRSWLYANSGDAEIQLIEHDIIPGDVVDAVCLALGCDDDDSDVSVERDGDTVKVYAGTQVFVARPAIFGGDTRRLEQNSNNNCWTVETDLRTMQLCPVAGDSNAVATTLPGAIVTEKGIVEMDNTPVCQLSLEQYQPTYPVGQSIPPITTNQASIAAVGNIFRITWPNQWQQDCTPITE